MNQKIFLFFFVSINLQVFTQNYAPVNPEWTYYYEPIIAHRIFLKETKYNWIFKQKYIKGVRVDSIDYENGSILYYLQKELEWDESYQYPYDCWYLYLLPGNGWLGSKILNTGPYYIFFNDHNDSIFIKSDAELYESWIMYESDSLTVTAEISKIDTICFLGVTDSVKFIGIKVYDSNQVLLNIKTLQEPLILSQNYGFVKLYNFKFFPDTSIINTVMFSHNLVGIPEKNLGISILTNEDVYDYEIGDELHYHKHSYYYPGGIYRISTCTGKTITPGNDSIVYTFRDIREYRGDQITISIVYSTIAFPLLNLPVIGISKLPLEATTESHPYYVPFLFYIFYRNNMDKLEIKYYDGIYYPATSICPEWSTIRYTEGIGKIKSNVEFDPHSGFSDATEHLLYYKIGAEEWGEPIVINTNILITGRDTCTIFPNPTDGEIYVNTDPDKIPLSISVISTNGIVLYTKSSDINTTEIIKLFGNKPGIYYLIINFENSVIRKKVILIY
jgi:hypothetical protein